MKFAKPKARGVSEPGVQILITLINLSFLSTYRCQLDTNSLISSLLSLLALAKSFWGGPDPPDLLHLQPGQRYPWLPGSPENPTPARARATFPPRSPHGSSENRAFARAMAAFPPKKLPRDPKKCQEAAKRLLRCPAIPPEASKRPQQPSKTPREAPRATQDAPKKHQEHPKRLP